MYQDLLRLLGTTENLIDLGKFGSSDNTEILEILTIDSNGVLITEK